ncbi:hypothetical protein JIG36_49435 [Actinoplanes sp. LDG1-06]|uniref:Uncharacterized protein n=1 Tax=Paractinoplanes ovalisporus TaxID=2810368 RepID=A0ABS2AVY0_9ACTN|nr:hypothetical protein [Actinoplanes ovalisporus]MBM2623543.1 hypothetical protein [Actinoplanes ovalisporus]
MRLPVPAAPAALALGLSVLFAPILVAQPAAAARAAIFLELSPSTVPAGDDVGLRASCDDNLKAATVASGLFGTVTVAPRFGFLTATAEVPGSTRPGDYRVDLRCPDGKTASATLHVVAKVQPARGPATGAGGTAPGRNAPLLIGSGLAIVAAAIGLGAVSLRRRRLG